MEAGWRASPRTISCLTTGTNAEYTYLLKANMYLWAKSVKRLKKYITEGRSFLVEQVVSAVAVHGTKIFLENIFLFILKYDTEYARFYDTEVFGHYLYRITNFMTLYFVLVRGKSLHYCVNEPLAVITDYPFLVILYNSSY